MLTLIALAFCLLVGFQGVLALSRRRRFGLLVRSKRIAGLWWQWLTEPRARGRLQRVGWLLVPRVSGALTEGIPGYLRYRVVSPREPVQVWGETFESISGSNSIVWHSLGNEAGTDNSINYWTQVLGSWSYAAHVLTSPNTGTGKIVAGHSDWGDCTYQLRFNWVTGSTPAALFHWVDTNNYVYLAVDGVNAVLHKVVAGTNTAVTTVANALTTGTWYWMQITSAGTSYTCNLFNDNAGALGTAKGGTIAGTIADAAVQNGQVGIAGLSVTTSTFGGAFSNVCNVTQFLPNFWSPVVLAGEPAFCLSTINPQAGTRSGSIQIVGSASGSGAWQQLTTLNATIATNQTMVSSYVKASAGTANVTAGGLTTPNAPTNATWTLETITGNITANPTIQCNFSGAVGVAYFDSMTIVNQGLELTNDLPHLHQSTWQVVGMQPGGPSSSFQGSFVIPLFPPGSEGFAAAWPIYSQLARWMRVEAYLGYDATNITLGKLKFAGFITSIKISDESVPTAELRGVCDVGLANVTRPFPGELTPNVVTSDLLNTYLGRNETGTSDNFNPFVAANYTSTSSPGSSAGAWSSTTDDGLTVITCATGGGAVLISKTGVAAADRWHQHYAEITGRLKPSSDTSSAGSVGIGFTKSNANANDSAFAFVQSFKDANSARYFLNATLKFYSGGAPGGSVTYNAVLSNVDDPNGFVPLTIGLLMTNEGTVGGASTITLMVNGKAVIQQFLTNRDAGTVPWYPAIFYSAAVTGSGPCYMTNLVHFVRFTSDGPSSASVFAQGTISAGPNSLGYGIDPGPTFLDIWTRCATREGWYWRYTPQAFVVGTRTIGTVDMAADPGTDRTASCIFSKKKGSLLGLTLDDNSDALASGTVVAGLSSLDGYGLGNYWDIATLQSIGVIQDVTLATTQVNYDSLRRAGQQVMANKVKTGTTGHKTATLLRDGETADVWRELDRVTIDDPEKGINMLSARIMARTFVEGQPYEQVVLDQFSWHNRELLAA